MMSFSCVDISILIKATELHWGIFFQFPLILGKNPNVEPNDYRLAKIEFLLSGTVLDVVYAHTLCGTLLPVLYNQYSHR